MPPVPVEQVFQWDVNSWSRAYPLWHRNLRALEAGNRLALALGERDGGLSLMLAGHGFTTVCSDLRGPTEKARELHHSFGLREAITYESIDALAIPKPDNSYDVLAFKSMLGALGTKERQLMAMREMYRVLKPGGVLLFAENLHGTGLHQWLRKRYVAWENYWRYLDPVTDSDLFASFRQVDEGTTGFLANLGRTEWQRGALARLDDLMLPMVPRNLRTIWYGAAIKG